VKKGMRFISIVLLFITSVFVFQTLSAFSSVTKVRRTISLLGVVAIPVVAWNIYKKECVSRGVFPAKKEFKVFLKKILRTAWKKDPKIKSALTIEHPYFKTLVWGTSAFCALTGLALGNDLFISLVSKKRIQGDLLDLHNLSSKDLDALVVKWEQTGYPVTEYKRIDLSNTPISVDVLNKLLHRFGEHSSALMLTNTKITDEYLGYISTHCKDLQELHLDQCGALTQEALKGLFNDLTDLQCVELSSEHQIDDEEIKKRIDISYAF
jgi:hypothetical protein